MKIFFDLFRENTIKENILVLSILSLFFILCFFIPSFSALPIFNYVTIALVALLCILILIWKLIFSRVILGKFFFAIVMFNFAILVSNFFNKDASHIITYITLSGMSFCLYQFFLEEKYRNIIKILIFASFIAFALYFIFFYRHSIFDLSIQRIGDRFDNLNTVGYYFLYAFVTSLCFINRKKPLSLLYIIPSFLFLFLLYRTGSRSAFILAVISVFVFMFYLFKGGKVVIPIIINASILLVGVLFVIIVNEVLHINILSRLVEFYDTLSGEGIDYSSLNRFELVLESFQLFLRKPVFGWGNNVFSIYSSERLFAHNNITELLCDFGLFGFIPFESIIVVGYIILKKYKRSSLTYDYSMILLLCVFGIQFFYVNSQLKFDWIAIAFITAEATLCYNHSEKNLNKVLFNFSEISI